MNLPAHVVLLSVFLSELVMASPIRAEVTLPAIYGDHMVLQEGVSLPIRGKADPGETVTVTVGSEKATATADAQGQWRAILPPLPAGGAPVTVMVQGAKKTLTLSDVLIGEVWLCSGQSNMQFGIGNDARKDEAIAQATDPGLRLFVVPQQTSLQPKDDIGPGKELEGKWQVCSPTVIGGKWGWNGFSGWAIISGGRFARRRASRWG
jgi:sialate O-acetylesterase